MAPTAFRLGSLALVALGMQLIAIYAPLGSDAPRHALFVCSYLVLLAFIVVNLPRVGLIVIGAGLLMNFLAIVANGGLMPVAPETIEKAGLPPRDVTLGEWAPSSKDVLLLREDTRLWPLTDRLVLKSPFPLKIFSPGDLVIAAGLGVLVLELALSRTSMSKS